jgi:hypothetical protein
MFDYKWIILRHMRKKTPETPAMLSILIDLSLMPVFSQLAQGRF